MSVNVKAGSVYHPKGNPGYAYALVSASDTVAVLLQLWTNTPDRGPIPGEVWETETVSLAHALEIGTVVEWEP